MGVTDIKGWGMTGSHAKVFSSERTSELFEGKPVIRMWRTDDREDGFGAMFQYFDARKFLGKRVRLSAALRTVGVTDRAALCLRVDGKSMSKHVAFDNMDNRPPIRGTTEWARHACVVDVPRKARGIFISNILSGRGELFWADVRFEIVDESVPVTDMQKSAPNHHKKPTNLDFSL